MERIDEQVRMGDALAALGRKFGLTNKDFDILDQQTPEPNAEFTELFDQFDETNKALASLMEEPLDELPQSREGLY